MGTVVFPDAPVKIFLDASPEERAQRRMLQLQDNGFNVNFDRLLAEIKERGPEPMHRQRLLKAQLRDYDRGRRVLLSRLKGGQS